MRLLMSWAEYKEARDFFCVLDFINTAMGVEVRFERPRAKSESEKMDVQDLIRPSLVLFEFCLSKKRSDLRRAPLRSLVFAQPLVLWNPLPRWVCQPCAEIQGFSDWLGSGHVKKLFFKYRISIS